MKIGTLKIDTCNDCPGFTRSGDLGWECSFGAFLKLYHYENKQISDTCPLRKADLEIDNKSIARSYANALYEKEAVFLYMCSSEDMEVSMLLDWIDLNLDETDSIEKSVDFNTDELKSMRERAEDIVAEIKTW